MWSPKFLLYIGGAAAVLAAAPSPTFAEQLTISFPTLGAEAATEPVVVVDGQLGVPSDPDRLGVYQVQGNLLVVGHLDWAGQRRVLSMARDFEGGEPIVLSDGRATTSRGLVRCRSTTTRASGQPLLPQRMTC